MPIQRAYRQDTITQADLADCAAKQEATWLAERLAQKTLFDLEGRLLHGATIESGRLTFDARLRMTRIGASYFGWS